MFGKPHVIVADKSQGLEVLFCISQVYEKKKVQMIACALQEMDVLCSSSSGAVLLPQKHVPGSASGGSPALLGPLFPGQALTCQEGDKCLILVLHA